VKVSQENPMSAVKPALQQEECGAEIFAPLNTADVAVSGAPLLAVSPTLSSPEVQRVSGPLSSPKETSFQPRIPVITGEATYRGSAQVHGIISGQLGAGGNTLMIKQRPQNGASEPELDGELSFKDMLRINGHVAGKVSSNKGTLIVDTSATVEAEINVSICMVSGTVVGDIIGRERVEVAAGAVVKGTIATRALSIKPGAVFQGDCRMLRDDEKP
jgi:cytoskeletal protein CcmA (bactofilin family)